MAVDEDQLTQVESESLQLESHQARRWISGSPATCVTASSWARRARPVTAGQATRRCRPRPGWQGCVNRGGVDNSFLRPIERGVSGEAEVILMHALDRPHLPHGVVAGIAATVLAIVITFVLAGSLGDISQVGRSTPTPIRTAAPARASATWLGNPFTTPLGPPVRQPWGAGAR
jgi:hypothetical protein